MEKKEIKPLKVKLLEAINRVLKNNKSDLTNKMEKVVKKSTKGITKRSKKQAESNY